MSPFSLHELFDRLPPHLSSRIATYEFIDDLRVGRREIVGFTGRSGVGKSELLRLAVDRMLAEKRIHFKYLPQDLPLFPHVSIRANVRALSDGSRLEAVLGSAPQLKTALGGRESWSPATLSGGERRQLVLLSVMSSNPELLIIDETFISLDSARLYWALSELRKRVDTGAVGAAIIVSHDSRILAQCDRVFELSELGGRRVLEASGIEADEPFVVEFQESTASANRLTAPSRLRSLGRAIVGSVLAVTFLLALLTSPRIWGGAELGRVVPSVSEVVGLAYSERSAILKEGWWSFQNAVTALVCALCLSLTFWFFSGISSGVRRFTWSAWVGLQSIPVILLSPLVVIVWGYSGRLLEVVIAIFIAVFPLGLVGARAIFATPPDLLRAHKATGPWRRFTIGSRYALGELARGFIACAPLSTVGVVVAEYLIRDRGLGNLVHRGLTDSATFTRAYAFVLASVLLALVVVMLSTVAALVVLPRDVPAD